MADLTLTCIASSSSSSTSYGHGKTPLHVARYPTGLDEKIQDLERIVLLQQQTQKSTVVGIVGLGGVGKSTLAREFYNRYRSNYDRHCFLSDVRETAAKSSLSSLQEALLKDLTHYFEGVQIRNTREGIGELRKHLSSSPSSSLIVLDDVDHNDQLDTLFSPVKDSIISSSLILVTSRNRDLLTSSGIVEESIYKQTSLNQQHSRQLFCCYAFDQTFPNEGFEQLVEDFLGVCDGLPLSLKVIGALIRGKDLEYWKAQLRKIHRIAPSDILRRLQTSYDSLDEEEQEIFLDIACFLIGENRDTAITIWNASGWEGSLGLRYLENRGLVDIDSENCIRMHGHVRDLGRYAAEYRHAAELRLSRPLNFDLLRTLSSSSYVVRGINMDYGNGVEQFFEGVVGSCNISSLQLLRGQGSFVERVFSSLEFRQLIYLRWEECPISSLYFTNLTRNLRVLYIEGGNLKTLWQDESRAPLKLKELYIDAPLSEVPESIGKLNQLEKIVVKNSVFKALPNVFHQMHCLKYICLKYCRKMMLLPDSVGILTALRTLELLGCSSLQGLPDSVGQLTGLQQLYMPECHSLQGLPDSLGQLTGLQNINLKGCSSLQGLPDSVGKLTDLQSINLEGCFNLKGLPDSVGKLTCLQQLYMPRCHSLQGLPGSLGQLTGLQSINLEGCSSLQGLPDSIGKLTKLEYIDLSRCSSLQILPDSFADLSTLHRIGLSQCWNLRMLPSALGNLSSLHHIDLSQCSNLQLLPDSFENLTNLHHIDLSQCFNLKIPLDSFRNFMELKYIDLSGYFNLRLLPDSFGELTDLRHINLSGCFNLETFPQGDWERD